MAIERKWSAVSPQALTANGTSLGVLTVADASLFFVKQLIILDSTTQDGIQLVVNRVTSATTLEVGPAKGKITERFDASAYLVADTATIEALEQPRNTIGPDDIAQAVYEQEPAVANRVILVDGLGDRISDENPLPVDASVSVGDVHVQLTHLDDTPDLGDVADSVRIGDGVDTATTDKHDLESKVGLHTVELTGVVDVPWDYMEVTSQNSKGDPLVIEYSDNSVLVRTITLTYDSKRNVITTTKS